MTETQELLLVILIDKNIEPRTQTLAASYHDRGLIRSRAFAEASVNIRKMYRYLVQKIYEVNEKNPSWLTAAYSSIYDVCKSGLVYAASVTLPLYQTAKASVKSTSYIQRTAKIWTIATKCNSERILVSCP